MLQWNGRARLQIVAVMSHVASDVGSCLASALAHHYRRSAYLGHLVCRTLTRPEHPGALA